jgi:hypothetical protein
MNTEFKVGDKVYCVKDYINNEYNLYSGKEYIIEKISEMAETLKLHGIKGYWSYDRFSKTKPVNKNQSMNTQKVCIKVHSEEINDSLWADLVKLGYRTSDKPYFWEEHETYIWVDINKEDQLQSADNNGSCWFINWDYKFDTETDLDKIYTFYGINKEKSNKTMTNKKIAIKVGANEHLCQVVLNVLYSKGFKWCGKGKEPDLFDMNLYVGQLAFAVNCYGKNDITFGPIDSNVYKRFLKFDAATEFGAFLNALNEPAKPVIKIRNDNGLEYEADFVKNPGYVTFGCAKISTNVFSVLYDALNAKIAPYSKGVEQIKIGRGLFAPVDIENIVKHPDFK